MARLKLPPDHVPYEFVPVAAGTPVLPLLPTEALSLAAGRYSGSGQLSRVRDFYEGCAEWSDDWMRRLEITEYLPVGETAGGHPAGPAWPTGPPACTFSLFLAFQLALLLNSSPPRPLSVLPVPAERSRLRCGGAQTLQEGEAWIQTFYTEPVELFLTLSLGLVLPTLLYKASCG